MAVVRTRFSPSPTGMLHLGNARAALFSALFAKKNNGVFILRVEDTDLLRSEERFVEALRNDLDWLGVHWQEGPGLEGPYGPYWQSQRQAIYEEYYQILKEKKLMYPCFCTDQELQLSRKLQLSRGQAPRYSGVCKKLSAEQITERLAVGKKPAWRFSVPAGKVIEYVDLVKGLQQFQTNEMGDFIIRRADGTAPFLFCNAVDDATMKVTHVLRGEDHVANTPRQIMLMNALALNPPHYGHLSLIVGDDGAPLSKRHGSFGLHDMREQGYLPSALINYLARLGHSLELNELLDFEQLAQHFQVEKLGCSATHFDKNQLLFWQKMAVQQLDQPMIQRWLGEAICGQIPQAHLADFIRTIKANIEFPQDASMWAKIFFHDRVDIDEANKALIIEAGEQFFVEAELAVDKYGKDLPAILNEMKQTLGVSGKKLFMPLRVAFTGKSYGPELAAIIELLGEKKVKHRLSQAFKLASEGG